MDADLCDSDERLAIRGRSEALYAFLGHAFGGAHRPQASGVEHEQHSAD